MTAKSTRLPIGDETDLWVEVNEEENTITLSIDGTEYGLCDSALRHVCHAPKDQLSFRLVRKDDNDPSAS